MKIREIRLRKFKRFTDTTITDIPETARLVILAGPNGCGKSSLVDGVLMWHRTTWRGNWDESYHHKQIPGEGADANQSAHVAFHTQFAREKTPRNAVYVRSAYRNEPEFSVDRLERIEAAANEVRINRTIENDQAVGLNYRRLVSNGIEDIYEREPATRTLGEFRERSLGPIRDVMQRLFPGLVLNSIGNPLTDGTFRFDKGDSKGFLYKNLSGGEKAAFDLLLDLMIKRREFDDTVFFIDEPEAHMAAGLQGALLSELLDAVSPTSQLWLATHSLGMMRRAREIENASPGSVVFLDFDGQNFDVPATLRPTKPDRPFWKRAMQIALDDLAGFISPEQVVLCEGGGLAPGRDFDAACYNEIFQATHPMVLFIGGGSSLDIQNDPRGVSALVRVLAPDVGVVRMIDRDNLTDAEIAELRTRGIRPLSRRTIESYLLGEDVLTAFCATLGHPEHAPRLLEARADAIQNSINRGNPPDDWKSPAGEIYNVARQLFADYKLGSDARVFMRSFCAKELRPGIAAYDELRADIFGTT